MQTNRNAGSAPKKRHRLAVILPLFIGSLCISSLGSVSSTASVKGVETEVLDGVLYQSDIGSLTVSGALLTVGEGMHAIAAKGFVQLKVADVTLQSWHGVFDVALQHNVLTVAALTAPVYVEQGSGSFAIPALTQMSIEMGEGATISRLVPLPTHYLKERLPVARSLFASAMFTEEYFPKTSIGLGRQLADALGKGAERSILPVFLAASLAHRSIALLHPAIRNDAFAALTEGQMQSIPNTVLLIIPQSDRLEKPLHPIVKRLWADALEVRIKQSSNAEETVHSFLSSIEIGMEDLRDYPLRRAVFTEVLRSVLAPYSMLLTEEDTAFLTYSIQPLYAPVTLPVQDIALNAEPAMDLGEALTKAHMRLDQIGAMQTPQTVFEPRDDGRVYIDGAVLGTANGDTLLRFTYNPQEDTAEDIEYNGQILPYGMELQAYAAWVRGE